MSEDTTINSGDNPEVPEKGIVNLSLEKEMQDCYLDYAMSVIVGRALPDVRDGLKPVHRRVLFSMSELNNYYNKPYLKSARIVGDTIGKYHPHGDSAVYQTIVRMAQPFSMRYMLVDGQGNFGSVDGDSAAAMRYTEIRMQKLTSEMLQDIDKNTVDFSPNYANDDKLKEPKVLPARIPNLLINGSQGIAVGMATHVPPHNLGEIIDGLREVIKNPNITPVELLQFIKGPDFPTAGFICGRAGIVNAYTTGRGVVIMRAKAEIEIGKKEKESIIITEIPYLVNKANLILNIAELVKNKRIEGISDIRDESDRKGMRIVVDIKKGAPSKIILNNLYKYTSMQSSFGIIMLALANNVPKIFNIKEMLDHFINFRKEIVIRRTQFELEKAQARAHILEGLKIAVENIDEVVALVRKADSPETAKNQLRERYELTGTQAQAILDMRLQRLTGLERDKIIEDYKEVLEQIKKLKGILSSEALIIQIILDEFAEIKEKYNDPRRTQLIEDASEIAIEDILSDDQMVITRTHLGYIKRASVDVYKSQKRGGKGVIGMSTNEEDFIETIFTASNHSSLLIFTNLGRCFTLKVHQIPQASRTARGTAIVNILDLGKGEKPMAVVTVKEFKEGSFIILITSKGIIKKMNVKNFEKVLKKGIKAINLKEEELIGAKLISHDHENIFIGTKKGQSIRFDQNDLRDIGRAARGVKGISLGSSDIAVGAEVLNPSEDTAAILTITEKGYGKRTSLEEYRMQGRGGSGIKTVAITDKNGTVVSMRQVMENDEIMVITSNGNIIRMKASDISKQGRNTQGVRIVRLSAGETVADIAIINPEEADEPSSPDKEETDS